MTSKIASSASAATEISVADTSAMAVRRPSPLLVAGIGGEESIGIFVAGVKLAISHRLTRALLYDVSIPTRRGPGRVTGSGISLTPKA